MAVNWDSNVGATEEELNRLIKESKKNLPNEYISLLRKYNGGEGDLALEPMWLQLWSVNQVLESQDWEIYAEYPDFFFFASNGGLESIAFKINKTGVSEIFMFDLIAGPASCVKIADNFLQFEKAIGKEYKEG